MRLKINWISFSVLVVCLTIIQSNPVFSAPFQYYNIVGSSFINSAVGQVFTKSTGCLRITDNGWFSFPVVLPNGSTIKRIEMFYEDNTVGSSTLELIVSGFPLNGSEEYEYIASISSTNTPGIGHVASDELNHIVDNANVFYKLYWYSSPNSTFKSLCGARILYLPASGLSYLPLITK